LRWLKVKVPSDAVEVPDVVLLKNTLANGNGALLSARVTLPVIMPLCASVIIGKNNRRINQEKRIKPNLKYFFEDAK